MSGLNQNLQEDDKIQCLSCLSNKVPVMDNNRAICLDCKTIIPGTIHVSPELPLELAVKRL